MAKGIYAHMLNGKEGVAAISLYELQQPPAQVHTLLSPFPCSFSSTSSSSSSILQRRSAGHTKGCLSHYFLLHSLVGLKGSVYRSKSFLPFSSFFYISSMLKTFSYSVFYVFLGRKPGKQEGIIVRGWYLFLQAYRLIHSCCWAFFDLLLLSSHFYMIVMNFLCSSVFLCIFRSY